MQCHVMYSEYSTRYVFFVNQSPTLEQRRDCRDSKGWVVGGRLGPAGGSKKCCYGDIIGIQWDLFIYIYILYIYNGLQTNMISFQFTRSLVLLKNNCSFSASAFGQFARRTMPGVGLFTLFGHISLERLHRSFFLFARPISGLKKLVPLEFKKWIPVKQHKLADDWSCLPNWPFEEVWAANFWWISRKPWGWVFFSFKSEDTNIWTGFLDELLRLINCFCGESGIITNHQLEIPI